MNHCETILRCMYLVHVFDVSGNALCSLFPVGVYRLIVLLGKRHRDLELLCLSTVFLRSKWCKVHRIRLTYLGVCIRKL